MIFRCLWTSYDYISDQKIQDDFVVGGIVSFEMFFYPEACLTSNKWVMRNMLPTDERLKHIPFPDTTGNLIDTPVHVVFKIPEKVYVGEDATSLKIGVWDSE